jgi:hypothetical protein
MNILDDILAPLGDCPSESVEPSKDIAVGDFVSIHKIGWAGRGYVTEIKNGHIGISINDEYVWFHPNECKKEKKL